jgi:hypothetical protein
MTKETEVTAPEGWRPEPGDTIAGKIVSTDKGWSDFKNAFYPILTIQTAEGEISVHCFHQTLLSRLKAMRPKIGDDISITYQGKRETKDGKRTAAIYSVKGPDHGEATYWDDMDDGRTPSGHSRQTQIPVEGDDIPF